MKKEEASEEVKHGEGEEEKEEGTCSCDWKKEEEIRLTEIELWKRMQDEDARWRFVQYFVMAYHPQLCRAMHEDPRCQACTENKCNSQR